MKIFSLTFRFVVIIFAIAQLISYSSRFVDPSNFWYPSFFGMYFIPISVFNFSLLAIALFAKSKSGYISGIILLPLIFYTPYFVQLRDKKIDDNIINNENLKILSYNVGRFVNGKDSPTDFNEFLTRENPDIICFQEYLTEDTLKIKTDFPDYKFSKYYLYRLKNGSFFGNLTLSKYPINNAGMISMKGSTNLTLFSDININGNEYRLYNCHLESYSIVIRRLFENKEDRANKIMAAHERMIGSNKKRSKQVDMILEDIDNYEGEVIICGDFNDDPMSFTYHKLSYGRKDTFMEGGRGAGATYSEFWPLLRIDYIFLPENFAIGEHIVHKEAFSDHYPITTTFYQNT